MKTYEIKGFCHLMACWYTHKVKADCVRDAIIGYENETKNEVVEIHLQRDADDNIERSIRHTQAVHAVAVAWAPEITEGTKTR